jgi:peptidoglycan/LPS O-acetylase OafA/YrhL
MSLRSDQRVPELDGLRGIAIALVVYFHCIVEPGLLLPFPFKWFNLTVGQTFWCGVDLFFVLSGFLIGGILLDEKNSKHFFSTFYMRRVCRILPIYLAMVGGFLLAWFLLGSSFGYGRVTLGRLFLPPLPWYSYLTFTQNFVMGAKNSYAFFCGASWSLAIEEQFYLTLPLLIWLFPRRFIGYVVAAAAIGCIVARIALASSGSINDVQVTALPFCRADDLLFGVGCAILVRNRRFREFIARSPAILYALAVLFGLLICAFIKGDIQCPRPIALTIWGLFFSAILMTASLFPHSPLCGVLRFRPLRALGTVSYGLYLIHDTVRIVLLRALVIHYRSADILLNDPSVVWWTMAFGIGFSILLAVLSWNLLEKHCIRLGKRFKYESTSLEYDRADGTLLSK